MAASGTFRGSARRSFASHSRRSASGSRGSSRDARAPAKARTFRTCSSPSLGTAGSFALDRCRANGGVGDHARLRWLRRQRRASRRARRDGRLRARTRSSLSAATYQDLRRVRRGSRHRRRIQRTVRRCVLRARGDPRLVLGRRVQSRGHRERRRRAHRSLIPRNASGVSHAGAARRSSDRERAALSDSRRRVRVGVGAVFAARRPRRRRSCVERRARSGCGRSSAARSSGCIVVASRGLLAGNGHLAIPRDIFGVLPWYVLIALSLAKILATVITLGSGGSGGVFTPALFIGASLGGGVGALMRDILPEHLVHPESWALVGMAGLVSGATRAPLTAIFMVYELTNESAYVVPLMIVSVVAFITAKRFAPYGLYDGWLAARGQHLAHGVDQSIIEHIRVRDAADTTTPHARIRRRTSAGAVTSDERRSARARCPSSTRTMSSLGLIGQHQLARSARAVVRCATADHRRGSHRAAARRWSRRSRCAKRWRR